METINRWCITGVAGFIGSHLLEKLLRLNQEVMGIDNFSTGYRANLEVVQKNVGEKLWQKFTLLEGDICDFSICQEGVRKIDFVLHQAALGSVPRSIADPITSTHTNVMGFLNLLVASRDAAVKRFVYASSSSVYGDWPEATKQEDKLGVPLSPYALTKKINEAYADVFKRCYQFSTIGLRYFNVFGPRQDPNGPYAAVIPKWIHQFIAKEHPIIFGDGETTRDFCFVENVVEANILAALTQNQQALNQNYNIAAGGRTTLNTLYRMIREKVSRQVSYPLPERPLYQPFRPGDIQHATADIRRAVEFLAYKPIHMLETGLEKTVVCF